MDVDSPYDYPMIIPMIIPLMIIPMIIPCIPMILPWWSNYTMMIQLYQWWSFGKHTKNDGKIHHFYDGKSTINDHVQ